MEGNPHVHLDDAQQRAREAPYTFLVPSAARLAAITPGDLVKLVFVLDPPGATYAAERMWVKVTMAGQDKLAGLLDNSPYEAQMKAGEALVFERRHVAAIEFADPAKEAIEDGREYFDRCMVDACVVEGKEPVEYLYREKPDPNLRKNDNYPDSGWRIRGRRGGTSDREMDERSIEYLALGVVLNKDDSWLHLIDAPVGSRFIRDSVSGLYLVDDAE